MQMHSENQYSSQNHFISMSIKLSQGLQRRKTCTFLLLCSFLLLLSCIHQCFNCGPHCTGTKQIVCAKISLLCNPPYCLEVRDFQKQCSKIWSVLQWPLPVENKIRNCLSSVAMLCTFPASSIFPNPGC